MCIRYRKSRDEERVTKKVLFTILQQLDILLEKMVEKCDNDDGFNFPMRS